MRKLFALGWTLGIAACGGGGEDPCREVDCSLHGRCRAVDGEAVCDCDSGYVALGIVCHPDWCAALACVHGACRQNAEFGRCECLAGWAGTLCDECAPGYHPLGDSCEPDAPCAGDPCVHGRCRVEGEAEVCDCDSGYAGALCDTCAEGYHPEGLVCEPDEPDACHPNPCTESHRTECALVASGFECRCEGGYHLEGDACVADAVCDPATTCSGHGACTGNGLECACELGYTGASCAACAAGYHPEGGGCVADAVCDPATTCSGHGSCTGVGLECACDLGYAGANCADCVAGYHPSGGLCLPDAGCEPNPCTEPFRTVCSDDGAGGFSCACDPGTHQLEDSCLPDCDAEADLCANAWESFGELVSSNGHGAVGYELATRKAHALLEHLYRNWDEDVWTRDLLFDSYLGLRTPGASRWLNTVDPVLVEYLQQTHVIHLVHRTDGMRVDTYLWAPYALSRPALVLVGRLTNEGVSAVSGSLFSLHNYHLGYTTTQDPVNPDAATERIVYRPTGGAYLETGIGGTLLHRPLGAVSHHGCTPDNPWLALTSGVDLADTADSGTGVDRVAGFQRTFALAPGESGWFGVVSAFERGTGAAAQAALETELETIFAGRDAEEVLSDALAEWEAWRTEPPAGLSTAERWLWRQSEAVLRQGQVRETSDLSFGQIVASLPPGNWNICWMRDMAYAIAALSRSGHLEEARAALEFVLLADSGHYQSYTGVPYQVTITRYFGRGLEESDENADGPNIEFDGFGLFLWALGEYFGAGGDPSPLEPHWPAVRDRVAGALVALVDPVTGLIVPDSSIWEVHWNGNQKSYSFTSLSAAAGLCAAADWADSRGETVLAGDWRAAAVSIRDALRAVSTDGDRVLASSYEELQAGSGYHDVASVEAFGWRLFDPQGQVAAATLDAFDDLLQVASGRGFFRNDDGGWYDSQEWVWADLRVAVAARRAGRTAAADRLLGWITAQALANRGLVAELHEPTTSAYEGEVPMVGYGAGAWMLAVLERLQPAAHAPVCGSWETP